MHAQTLRIYERKGLIEPQRTQGGSRRYSERDIALLRRIQELTNDGVSLSGVRRILELEERLARSEARVRELDEALDEARVDLAAAVEQVHRSYRRELVPLSQAVVRSRRR